MIHLSYLNKFFVKYKWRFTAGVLFVILSTAMSILPARLTRQAVDLVLNSQKQIAAKTLTETSENFLSGIYTQLLWFGLLIIGAILLRGLFMVYMRQTIIVASRYIEYDMKNEIYEHYQKLDAAFYSRNNTGDLMNRISEDVSRVRMFTGPAIMYTINVTVTMILVITAMLSISPQLTFYVLLPLPVMVVLIYFVQSIINKKGEEVQELLSHLSTNVQETFSGLRIIKSFAKENLFNKLFASRAQEYREKSLNLAKVHALFYPSILLLVGISTVNAIYFGGHLINDGKITPGNIAEFIIYINIFTWPLGTMGWTISLIQRAAASQKRINEFLDTEPSIVSPTNSIGQTLAGNISIKSISFYYSNTKAPAISNLSLQIKQGETIAITGPTGSGKTTLANLLLRFYDVSSGEILVDEKNIKEWNLESLRTQTGYVPQDVILFSDTLHNNIAFGLKENVTQLNDVENAAEVAAVLKDIKSFKNEFETVIGERGISLSGGQKQRISIARALIKKPQMLLLDDCLSAVDTVTEETILYNLREKLKGKTTLIFSHRISTIKYADRIIVLDKGNLVEEGTHEQLISKNGLYSKMVDEQVKQEVAENKRAE